MIGVLLFAGCRGKDKNPPVPLPPPTTKATPGHMDNVGPMKPMMTISVRLDATGDDLAERSLAILKDRIEQRSDAQVCQARDHVDIVLSIRATLAGDAFAIEDDGPAVRIVGGSSRGLLYGVGKFLRTSRYAGGFSPSTWRGVSAPRGTLRGMYYATHFHNWYHVASEAEIVRYTEDQALWGVNAIMVVFPAINLAGWDDPETDPAIRRMQMCAKAAKGLGMKFGIGGGNTLFRSTPKDLLATPLPDPMGRHGNSGFPVCPSNPKGMTEILDMHRRLFEKLSPTVPDLLCFWPYDEGGCACPQCSPWGANGYLRVSHALADLARAKFPKLKVILSTWTFDTPPEGEWEGLTRSLKKDGGWVDYILADAHEDFPRYPLDHGVPGGVPLVNFPEISMWGNSPWGGYGAHVLPRRFQRLWDQAKHVLAGGFPYSEGIYEDMNKAIVVQFYWDRDRSARDTLREYAAYEYSPAVVEDVLTIVDLLETTATQVQTNQPVSAANVRKAADLAQAVEERLPKQARQGWRWEILRIRTILDRERFAGGGLQTPTAVAAMRRLIAIYHCQEEITDPYHCRVRPPLNTGKSIAPGL